MSTRYRGILFDLDGTLVDSLELILSSYRHSLLTNLGREASDEDWLRTLGRPLRVQMQEFATSPSQLEALIETYLVHNQANHDRLVRSFPGMRDAVSTLRERGYRLGVVTSKLRDNALRELRTCNMDGLFDSIVTASDVERPKPDPQPVEMGLAGLELPAGEVLFVGDSVYDLRSGRAAGVDTAAALWGPFTREQLAPDRPNYWLEGIEELLSLLGQLRGREDGRG